MAKVKFIRRETNQEINNVPFVDGQILASAEGNLYTDYDGERISIGGGNVANQYSTSTSQAYSCNYINNMIGNVEELLEALL